MGQMCDKCTKLCGVLFLAVGVIFLLGDFGMWNFWGIQWWSALFVLMGVGSLGKASCKDCKKMKRR